MKINLSSAKVRPRRLIFLRNQAPRLGKPLPCSQQTDIGIRCCDNFCRAKVLSQQHHNSNTVNFVFCYQSKYRHKIWSLEKTPPHPTQKENVYLDSDEWHM